MYKSQQQDCLHTFCAPDGSDDVVLHAEDNGGDDDRGEARLGDVSGGRHEEGEAEDDQRPGVHTAQWGPHPARAVHRSPGEGARGRHGLDEGAEDVAQSESQHFLAGVHWFPPGCKIQRVSR